MTMSSVPKGTVQGNTWTYNDESLIGRPEGQVARDHQRSLAYGVHLHDGLPGTGRGIDARHGEQEHEGAVGMETQE